jgi:hypothetical protein
VEAAAAALGVVEGVPVAEALGVALALAPAAAALGVVEGVSVPVGVALGVALALAHSRRRAVWLESSQKCSTPVAACTATPLGPFSTGAAPSA